MDFFILPLTTIVLYFFYQIFYGLLSLYFTISYQAAPSDLSNLEAKLWREETLLATVATFFVWLARFNGLAFLVYLGFQTQWYYPIVLWVVALVGMIIINMFIRMIFGLVVPALIGFVVLPVTGIWMWFTV